MYARRAGLIVSVLPPASDEHGEAPLRAARAAVVGLSEGLAAEWAEAGIGVDWFDEAPPEELLAQLVRRAAGGGGGG